MRFIQSSGAIFFILTALAAVGPRAQAVVTLYSNANVTTGVGNGANGANTSAIASNGSTFGFSANGVGATASLAEDFTLSSTSTITAITFDAYSTATYTGTPASPFTAATVSIWSAQPGTAGAAVLFTSTTLSATAWTGVYRVQSTALTGATRPIMSLSVAFSNVPLVAGTYWMSYSITGIASPGVSTSIFTPPLMNTDGTMPAGNVIQSTNGGSTWVAVTDTTTAATSRVPLIVTGNAVPEPGATMWLAIGTFGMVMVVRRRRVLS